jgi:CheY-like chemotaxis protein
VRRFTRRALEELGYTVLEASNGREALERADAFAGAIDLVLTDVVLPGRNGREVVEALEARRPGVRALFMSGYTADALLHHRIAERDARFLEKPYTSEELARAVREAMEG